MWIAGPDLIANVLLSGHIPHVLEAFRIVPHGKQCGLKPIELRGAISIDPRKEDFFTRVIEYRKQNKTNDRGQVHRIVGKFGALNSYRRDIIPGSVLEIEDDNYDPKTRSSASSTAMPFRQNATRFSCGPKMASQRC